MREYSLPAWVRGPVDFCALRRLAAICFSDAITMFFPLKPAVAVRFRDSTREARFEGGGERKWLRGGEKYCCGFGDVLSHFPARAGHRWPLRLRGFQGGMRGAEAVAAVGHELLDIGDLDGDELREILVAGLRDQQHVFEAQAEVQVFDAHLGLDGEDLSGLERTGGHADVVDFHADAVAQAAAATLRLRAVTVDERLRRGFDFGIGEP